jgi:hypothetical protein
MKDNEVHAFFVFPTPMFRLLPLAVLCELVCSSWADPLLPHLLSDLMVLQQDRQIHIWGKADLGERITVTLADKTRSCRMFTGVGAFIFPPCAREDHSTLWSAARKPFSSKM